MGFAERVSAGDEGHRLLVIHRHAAESLSDIPCRSDRIGLSIGPVKFICGTQNPTTASNPCTPVRQGIYSTEVNIHNFHPVGTPPAVITKLALLLVHNDAPVGREPHFAPAVPPFANITLQPGTATMDDCCSLLGPLNLSLAQLNIGFLVLQSTVSLNVTAVYTATDLHSGSISIDVQSINERQV